MASSNCEVYMAQMADSTDWAAQTEARLLDAALPLAPEFGWTSRLVVAAAKAVGLTRPEAELLLPEGPRDLAALLSYRHDEAAIAALAGGVASELKIRERIARAIEARVEVAMADEAAVRRELGFLALPQNLALGARLAWESADRIWRWAGDTSADENHYSKRAILAALLSSTMMVRISNTPAAAARHLERGIGAVMSFEKMKARISSRPVAAAAAQALGRMRYGARRDDADSATPA